LSADPDERLNPPGVVKGKDNNPEAPVLDDSEDEL